MAGFPVVFNALKKAKNPEDIFGIDAVGPHDGKVKEIYRYLASIVHPDKAKVPEADVAFQLLQDWKGIADKKLADQTYGDRTALEKDITVTTGKVTYVLKKRFAGGDLSEVYYGEDNKGGKIVAKVVRSPKNNDLLINEHKKLKFIREESISKGKPSLVHLPECVDSFALQTTDGKKQLNVLKPIENSYTLEEVIQAYPKGIKPEDSCWMFNRLLGALVVAHQAGIVHGAVLPCHALIVPENHNGVLIDWSYAMAADEKPKAVVTKYKDWYPQDYFLKKPVNAGVDIYMLAQTMIRLLGGNPIDQSIPKTVPLTMQGILRACLLGPAVRTNSAFELFTEFNQVISKLWKKEFRHFTMPDRQ